MLLDAALLNTQHYKGRIKVNVNHLGKEVALSPTPRRSSYRKETLGIILDYDRQLYLLIYIYIPIQGMTINRIQRKGSLLVPFLSVDERLYCHYSHVHSDPC